LGQSISTPVKTRKKGEMDDHREPSEDASGVDQGMVNIDVPSGSSAKRSSVTIKSKSCSFEPNKDDVRKRTRILSVGNLRDIQEPVEHTAADLDENLASSDCSPTSSQRMVDDSVFGRIYMSTSPNKFLRSFSRRSATQQSLDGSPVSPTSPILAPRNRRFDPEDNLINAKTMKKSGSAMSDTNDEDGRRPSLMKDGMCGLDTISGTNLCHGYIDKKQEEENLVFANALNTLMDGERAANEGRLTKVVEGGFKATGALAAEPEIYEKVLYNHKIEMEEELGRQRWGSVWWIHSTQANLIFAFLITLNAVLMVVELETSHERTEESRYIFHIFEICFLTVFTIEILWRAIAQINWADSFYDSWQWFDIAIVTLSVTDLATTSRADGESLDSSGADVSGTLVTLRVLRILKIVRIIKVFRYLKDLSLLLQGILQTCRIMIWLICCLGLMVFLAAMFLTRLVLSLKHSTGVSFGTLELFGSLKNSMFNLFKVATLDSWGVISNTAAVDFPGISLFFILFILVTNILLLNILNGVIIENVLEVSRNDEGERAKRESEVQKLALQHLLALFVKADSNHDGFLTRDEFVEFLARRHKDQPIIRNAFFQAKMTFQEAHDLFDILDIHHKEGVTVQEFCEGFYRSQGVAQARHILELQYNVRAIGEGVAGLYNEHTEIRNLIDGQARAQARMLANQEKMMKAITNMRKSTGSLSSSPGVTRVPSRVSTIPEDMRQDHVCLRCEKCNLEYWSVSGKSSLCPKCRDEDQGFRVEIGTICAFREEGSDRWINGNITEFTDTGVMLETSAGLKHVVWQEVCPPEKPDAPWPQGSWVIYESLSYDAWVAGVITKFNDDGTYDLSNKLGALRERIRIRLVEDFIPVHKEGQPLLDKSTLLGSLY